VNGVAADLDRTIAAVDQAKDPAALTKALDAAEEKLNPDAQSAAADESTKQLAVDLEEQAAAKQQAAQKTATQELAQTIKELTTEREGLNVKRRELQATEDALRRQRAAKQRELNTTRDKAKRDQLTQEIEQLDEQVADAEADRITKQQEIEDVDIQILKARHPLDRVPQDLKVANTVAEPPKPLPGRKVGGTPNQEAQMRADVEAAVKQGAKDIRINERQVDANGRLQGTNRPDLQYTLGGRRIYIEYEQPSNPRGLRHATRLIPNDPTAKVIVKLVPKNPAFTPGQGVKQLVYTLDEVVKLVAGQP
jgi:DNA repair exonuclease SbcCD ATPase subunit